VTEPRRPRRRPASVGGIIPGGDAVVPNLPSDPFDYSAWVGSLRDELEDLRASPGGDDVFDDYRQRAHRGLAAIVGWLNTHPDFEDGGLTDPVQLLAIALTSAGGQRHPIVLPGSGKANGRPKLETTVQRVLSRNVLVGVSILIAGGKDHTAARLFMSRQMAAAGHNVRPKTIETWEAYAGTQTSMGRSVAAALNLMFGERPPAWSLNKAESERRAREIALSDELKYLSWGEILKT
jgi:hypothetical protein